MKGEQRHESIQELYQAARQYEAQADPYMAVKLYRKVIKLAPKWAPPYLRMAMLYKDRREWKPTFHYSKKVAELNPKNEEGWKIYGLAATALREPKLAAEIWHHLGLEAEQKEEKRIAPIAILLPQENQKEVVWARRVDPVRARIISIPQPASGHRFDDCVLIDPFQQGVRMVGDRRIPVYETLDLFERSAFQTFGLWVALEKMASLEVLSGLCREFGLGFDNWSLATRLLMNRQRAGDLEYHSFPQPTDQQRWLLAIAARQKVQVLKVLRQWQSLTSEEHSHPVRLLGWQE